MDNTALKPSFFSQFPSLKQDEEAKKRGATEEERLYYGMYNTAGWKQFQAMAEQLIGELDQLNDNAVASGATYEELGKNTVVVSLAKGIIKKLLNKVEDCKEACERPSEPTGGI